MTRLLLSLLCLVSFFLKAESELSKPEIISPSQEIPVLAIKGAIGPAVSDYLVRGITLAEQSENCPLIIITLDTPGGLSSSLRDINKSILSSTIPIACLVYPKGARAASAGTYILYACHKAAMATATTLGAATPVKIGGATTPGSDKPQESAKNAPNAMEQKVLNDAIAYIRSLAQLRGRNEKWAELAVKEAATLTAKEALEKNVIDIMAESPEELVKQLNNTFVMLNGQPQQLNLTKTRLVEHSPDWRNHFIATITDPNVAYILMLIGIYGILLEFYNPGIGIAGIAGGISLLIALYAFQMLPISYAGAGLLLLGIGLIIAESFVPSFGVFGLGGIVAFVLGSIFLIDSEQTDLTISIPLIAGLAVGSAVFLIFTLSFLWRSRHNKIVSGEEEIIGATVLVAETFCGQGYVIFNGERWAATSREKLNKGDFAEVNHLDGLTLSVNPLENKE